MARKHVALFLSVLVILTARLAVAQDAPADQRDAELRMLRSTVKKQADDLEPLRAKLRAKEKELADANAAATAREEDLQAQVEKLRQQLGTALKEIDRLKKEREAQIAAANAVPAKEQPLTVIPLIGDETNLAAVTADPLKFKDREIII